MTRITTTRRTQSAARLGEFGDVFVLMTYVQAEGFGGAPVVYCDERNAIADAFDYPTEHDAVIGAALDADDT